MCTSLLKTGTPIGSPPVCSGVVVLTLPHKSQFSSTIMVDILAQIRDRIIIASHYTQARPLISKGCNDCVIPPMIDAKYDVTRCRYTANIHCEQATIHQLSRRLLRCIVDRWINNELMTYTSQDVHVCTGANANRIGVSKKSLCRLINES